MIAPETIESALAAADRPIMLETPAEAARAAKAWRRNGLLAVDTEFVRERTYYANLGLVQISDGHTVWLLDPLIDGTLAPLRDMLVDPGIDKVLHSPSEDLDVLFHDTGAVPDPMIDTQLACALLGQPLQLGYHNAAEWLLGVAVDKELTRSNWCARPLRPELLRYAGLDVCLLPWMWQTLKHQLQEKDRLDWLEEDCRRQVEAARTPLAPGDVWLKIKGAGRLDSSSLAALRALAAWREKEARKRNRPRGFIVPDKVLLSIADARMRDPEELETIEELHPRARKRYARAITEIVGHVVDKNKRIPELPRLDSRQRHRLKSMRSRVSAAARELDMEPVVLASRKEIEDIMLGQPWPERLQGWRKPVLESALGEA